MKKNAVILVLIGIIVGLGWEWWKARYPVDTAPVTISLNLQDRPMRAAVEEIARRGGLNLDVNWQQLSARDVPVNRPITRAITNLRPEAAIDLAFRQGTNGRVHGVCVNGIVTAEDVRYAPPLAIRTYPVEDLLRKVDKSRETYGNLDQTRLPELVARATSPNLWDGKPDEPFDARIVDDKLIVEAPLSRHERIVDFLRILRQPGAAFQQQRTLAAPPSPVTQAIPPADFVDAQLDGALGQLAASIDVEMHVDWEALQTAGLWRDDVVTVNVPAGTLLHGLEVVLGSAKPRIAFVCAWDGQILRLTLPGHRTGTVIRTYDASDLLNRGLMNPNVSTTRPSDANENAFQLEELLRRMHPGDLALIGWWGGLMVVEQTPENQARIAELLKKLRESR